VGKSRFSLGISSGRQIFSWAKLWFGTRWTPNLIREYLLLGLEEDVYLLCGLRWLGALLVQRLAILLVRPWFFLVYPL